MSHHTSWPGNPQDTSREIWDSDDFRCFHQPGNSRDIPGNPGLGTGNNHFSQPVNSGIPMDCIELGSLLFQCWLVNKGYPGTM